MADDIGDPNIPGTAGFYLTALDTADREALASGDDELLDNALGAICHAVDGDATEADHHALRAWGVRLRLQGTDEKEVNSLMAVADDIAQKLGIQL